MNLSSTIKSIQDIMRKDDGVDGDAQRLGQLTWMLFLKVFDQREREWEDDAKDQRKQYTSPLPEEFRWRNWAEYVPGKDGKKQPQIAGSEIISFVNNRLFPQLKDLDATKGAQHAVIRSVFEDANNYMKSGTQLLAVIEKLEEAIHFDDFRERAQLGDVYEQLLNDLRGAGNAGEFYTPRAITQFMVERVNPRLDANEKVLDPACGTGGFLTAAIDHFAKQISTKSKANDKKKIETLIRGFEKKQLPHLLCTTNMLLHGIDVPSQIEHRNTLGRPWNDWGAHEKVMCLITNPPFGGYEDDGVGSDYPANLRTRETADMFMALIIKKLLHENGRAAVVLPDGFLFGEGIKGTLKEMLLRDCNLHTIIRLPKGVFAPYTTIKTNLLFFTKGAAVDGDGDHFHTDTIWFYEHRYPKGYKSYSKTKPIQLEEFAPIKEWWGSEADNFAAREAYDADAEITDKKAWKYEFGKARKQAVAAAQPHWQRAEQLNNEASALENRVRDLRESIKGIVDQAQRRPVEDEIDMLRPQIEGLRLQARDAQSAGDRIYWPIYNLDYYGKNPYAAEEETHDPDVLLEKYRTLLGQIEETENQLKSELAAALAHHFTVEAAEE
ncbi:type I restriction-modification system subunit M [Chitiniphilus eburneus]|uniref:site-specific DNA-methyltransferase (adenine-specific) n=1 Tax=Chitiniphilus eburneus TaxID=2571148 RepID=A0A4U0Q025_9NEIS|nr:type I restriction-modification system subunit M [Chitiniphilus eburneus]TJZ74235.1 SAM-dependent DNA methyltransferase [Chitiniphilus eburneus]